MTLRCSVHDSAEEEIKLSSPPNIIILIYRFISESFKITYVDLIKFSYKKQV